MPQPLARLVTCKVGAGLDVWQPNGEAFVEFANEIDLQRALTLNKENLGHRYVSP